MLCECCGKEGSVKRCGRCHETWYCSPACQKKHWKQGHKTKCVEKADKPRAVPLAMSAAMDSVAAQSAAGSSISSSSSRGGGDDTSGNMSVRELKAFLDARGVDHSKCIEKSDLRALVRENAAVPAGGRSGGEDCAICLDTLLQPQTMPCGHHFCRGCVASMRKHGVGEEQMCPLCRGPMPDAERLFFEGTCLGAQFDKWDGHSAVKKTGSSPRKTQPAWVRQLLRRAVALFQQALAIDDAQPNWHNSLACALANSGDKDGALCAYRRAIELDPADALTKVNYGIALWWKDEPGGPTVNVAGAEAAFRAAVNAAPTPDFANCAWAHFNLGSLLYTEHRDLDGAEAAWRICLAADPSSASSHFQLGCIASARQDYDGAARLFATAHQLDPTEANAKLQMEKNLQAARTVRAAAKQRSDQNDQLRRIGEALFRPQHGDDWESVFERIKGEEMQYCREHGFDTTGFE